MNVPDWVKPAAWGVVGGAIAAIIVGFSWGGWVSGGTATKMEAASAQAAIVLAFTPLCVAKAEQQPKKLLLLKAEKSWKRDDFVVEAGWVANVNEKYRAEVARVCALAVIEAMEAKSTATPAK
jgi:dienelactone hydrolase